MTYRWHCKVRDFVKDEEVDDFLIDIIKICRKYNFSLFQDGEHFIVRSLEKAENDVTGAYTDWIFSADIDV